MQNEIIAVENLTKSYGQLTAVNKISFSVARGQLFSFLGPNGAGKSTTIDMLCTLLRPDGGRAAIDGLDLMKKPGEIRRRIGVVFQNNMLDDLLSVRDNISMRARLYNRDRAAAAAAVAAAAEITEIGAFLDRPYGKLSGGQRRRADIARALVHTPQLLILDEPTTGLDPQTRRNIWQTIQKLKNETGMTVFLTTHYMEEAAESDYVVVIDHGEISASGTPGRLKEQYASDRLRLAPVNMKETEALLLQKGVPYSHLGGELTVALDTTLAALPLLELLSGRLESFEVVRGTLDDAFIGITGGALRQ